MDRFRPILNSLSEAAQKTYKGQKRADKQKLSVKKVIANELSRIFKLGDKVRNTNTSCMHYGSEGIVKAFHELPQDMGCVVDYETTNSGDTWSKGERLKKTESQLQKIDPAEMDHEGPGIESKTVMPALPTDDQEVVQMDYAVKPDVVMPNMLSPINTPPQAKEEDEEEMEDEDESVEDELKEYKSDFLEMNIGSLRAIMQHAENILNSLNDPSVKENLTESWLQGKIAITEDYMRTIHDFVMFVQESDDNTESSSKPGLWENIQKKKEKMGKKYRPAKPGDKDRPDPDTWKKLTK